MTSRASIPRRMMVVACVVLLHATVSLSQQPTPGGKSATEESKARACEAMLANEPLARDAVPEIARQDAKGDTLMAARAEARLLWSLRRAHRFEAAQCVVDALLARAVSSGEVEVLDRARYGQARLWVEQGQRLGDSYWLLANMESPVFLEVKGPEQRNLASLRATITYELGRYDETRQHRERQLELAQGDGGNEYSLANAHFNLAVLALARATLDPDSRARARQLFERAVAVVEGAEDDRMRHLEGRSRHLLGMLLEGGDAVAELDACLVIADRLRDPGLEGSCLTAKAAHRLEHDPIEARELLDRGLDKLRGTGEIPGTSGSAWGASLWNIAYRWPERFHVRWQTLPRDEAFRDSVAVLDLIETLRASQTRTGDRARLMSVWGEPYRRLAGYLLRNAPGLDPGEAREAIERAFEVMERMRGRAMAESLALSSSLETPPAAAKAPRPLDEIRRERVALQRLLRDPRLPDRDQLFVRLEALEAQEALLERQHDPVDPVLAPSPARLADIEAQLEPNEALLAFQLSSKEDVYGFPAGGSWVIVVTRQGSSVHPLAKADRSLIDGVVPTLIEVIAESADQSEKGRQQRLSLIESNLEALAERLLDDALEHLPPEIDHLVLVPDGLLHLVPFAALRVGAERTPLAWRYATSSAPSAALWLHWRSLPPSRAADAPALILADSPVARSARPSSGELSTSTTRQWELEGEVELAPLPGARIEGERIRHRLLRGSELWIGAKVSEARFKKVQPGAFEILHFATHALIDDLRPQRSSIWLSPGGWEQDGLLQPSEISDTDHPAQVVVLSTCNSATGLLLPNEGALSLARPFFRAGSRAVVGSLWQLPDQETATLFGRFYDHLATGTSVARALSLAVRDQSQKGVDPRGWAGLTVLGDGALVPFPGGLGPGAPIAVSTAGGYHAPLLILFAILAGLIFYRILKRRRAQLAIGSQGPHPPDEQGPRR